MGNTATKLMIQGAVSQIPKVYYMFMIRRQDSHFRTNLHVVRKWGKEEVKANCAGLLQAWNVQALCIPLCLTTIGTKTFFRPSFQLGEHCQVWLAETALEPHQGAVLSPSIWETWALPCPKYVLHNLATVWPARCRLSMQKESSFFFKLSFSVYLEPNAKWPPGGGADPGIMIHFFI